MNRIFVVAVVLLVVFLSGCIQSEISSINDMSSTVNVHMKKGDEYYNQSAINANRMSLSQALTDSNNAKDEYSLAETSAQTALDSAKSVNDAVFIEYIQYALLEIQAKSNATRELNTAIKLLQTNQTTSANTHLISANNYMNQALQFKADRAEVMRQNPTKFK